MSANEAPKQEGAVKKGKPSWRPAARMNLKAIDGYRLRWCDEDKANIDKKLAEGWVPMNSVTGLKAEHVERPSGVSDGKPLDTSGKYRELVPMALPEEQGQARDAYFEELTQRQTTKPVGELKSQAGAIGGSIRGKVVIE